MDIQGGAVQCDDGGITGDISLDRKIKLMLLSRISASCFSEKSVISFPWIYTFPSLGYTTQPIRESSVVLPEPDGPMISISSFLWTSKVVLSNATMVVSPVT